MIEQALGIVYFILWAALSAAGFAVCLLNLTDALADREWAEREYGVLTAEYDIATDYVRREATRLGMAFLFLLTVVAAVTASVLVGMFLVLANALVVVNSIGERRARKRRLGGGHANGN